MSDQHKADYRDCLDLAADIAKSVECYDSDDLPEAIIPHLQPVIGEIDTLRVRVARLEKLLRECELFLRVERYDHNYKASLWSDITAALSDTPANKERT